MNAIETLSRNEMKKIKGGCSIETNYEGCGSALAVTSCWQSLCMNPSIVPVYQSADCVEQVEWAKLSIESTCGPIFN